MAFCQYGIMEYMSRLEEKSEVKRIDASGRINLGKEFANKQVLVTRTEEGDFTITPVAVIPERELWLWKNPERLRQVSEGLRESAAGQTQDLGSFLEYAAEETAGSERADKE